eukprot:TRINITY_DN25345_c0_g1_i1.p1 TRINITY_DN25345_c0_g1~~TRINITY_DN25345_c0_g1_i1.p1  ORF type:complete len:1096 (+),score=200.51 TRINITY_DN25345_c0_g1_i1:125-3412(+)
MVVGAETRPPLPIPAWNQTEDIATMDPLKFRVLHRRRHWHRQHLEEIRGCYDAEETEREVRDLHAKAANQRRTRLKHQREEGLELMRQNTRLVERLCSVMRESAARQKAILMPRPPAGAPMQRGTLNTVFRRKVARQIDKENQAMVGRLMCAAPQVETRTTLLERYKAHKGHVSRAQRIFRRGVDVQAGRPPPPLGSTMKGVLTPRPGEGRHALLGGSASAASQGADAGEGSSPQPPPVARVPYPPASACSGGPRRPSPRPACASAGSARSTAPSSTTTGQSWRGKSAPPQRAEPQRPSSGKPSSRGSEKEAVEMALATGDASDGDDGNNVQASTGDVGDASMNADQAPAASVSQSREETRNDGDDEYGFEDSNPSERVDTQGLGSSEAHLADASGEHVHSALAAAETSEATAVEASGEDVRTPQVGAEDNSQVEASRDSARASDDALRGGSHGDSASSVGAGRADAAGDGPSVESLNVGETSLVQSASATTEMQQVSQHDVEASIAPSHASAKTSSAPEVVAEAGMNPSHVSAQSANGAESSIDRTPSQELAQTAAVLEVTDVINRVSMKMSDASSRVIRSELSVVADGNNDFVANDSASDARCTLQDRASDRAAAAVTVHAALAGVASHACRASEPVAAEANAEEVRCEPQTNDVLSRNETNHVADKADDEGLKDLQGDAQAHDDSPRSGEFETSGGGYEDAQKASAQDTHVEPQTLSAEAKPVATVAAVAKPVATTNVVAQAVAVKASAPTVAVAKATASAKAIASATVTAQPVSATSVKAVAVGKAPAVAVATAQVKPAVVAKAQAQPVAVAKVQAQPVPSVDSSPQDDSQHETADAVDARSEGLTDAERKSEGAASHEANDLANSSHNSQVAEEDESVRGATSQPHAVSVDRNDHGEEQDVSPRNSASWASKSGASQELGQEHLGDGGEASAHSSRRSNSNRSLGSDGHEGARSGRESREDVARDEDDEHADDKESENYSDAEYDDDEFEGGGAREAGDADKAASSEADDYEDEDGFASESDKEDADESLVEDDFESESNDSFDAEEPPQSSSRAEAAQESQSWEKESASNAFDNNVADDYEFEEDSRND